MSNQNELDIISTDLMDLIDKQIQYNNSKSTQVKSAIVDGVDLNGTVQLHIPPDNTVFKNIQNQSIYKMKKGMSVKVLKENNNSSNMWVIGCFNEQSVDVEKRFLEEIGTNEINQIFKTEVMQNVIIQQEQNGGQGGTGSGGSGGSGGNITPEELEDSEAVSALNFQNNEVLSLKEFAITGFIINGGKTLQFTIPLNKSPRKIRNIGINRMEMLAFQLDKILYGVSETKTKYSVQISSESNNGIFNNDGLFSSIKISNIRQGYLTFSLNKILPFNDGGCIDYSTCGILLDLDLTFYTMGAEITNENDTLIIGEEEDDEYVI